MEELFILKIWKKNKKTILDIISENIKGEPNEDLYKQALSDYEDFIENRFEKI